MGMFLKDIREATFTSKLDNVNRVNKVDKRKKPVWIPSFKDKMRAWDLYTKGCTDKEIAQALNVTSNQFNQYILEFKRFFEDMRRRRPKDIPKLTRRAKTDENPLLTPQAIRLFALSGLTRVEIANIAGVSHQTISNYFTRHPEIERIYNTFGQVADAKVIGALYSRATGMSVKKVKFASHEGIITDQKEYKEELPPSVEAAMHWLVNRKRWKKSDGNVLASNKGSILEAIEQLTNIDNEELDRLDKENSIE